MFNPILKKKSTDRNIQGDAKLQKQNYLKLCYFVFNTKPRVQFQMILFIRYAMFTTFTRIYGSGCSKVSIGMSFVKLQTVRH